MMRLLRSWRDSLLFFNPHSFKLFLLVTLKSTLETYKVFLQNWPYTIMPMLGVYACFGFSFIHSHMTMYDWLIYLMSSLINAELFSLQWIEDIVLLIGHMVTFAALSCQLIVATRPSVGFKNSAYWIHYARYILLLMIPTLIFFIPPAMWMLFVHRGMLPEASMLMKSMLMNNTNTAGPLYALYVLFFLDSDGTCKQLLLSARNMIKMAFFNAPILCVFSALIISLNLTIDYLLGNLYALAVILNIILITFAANVWANVYIKKLHEQSDLYFNQPK